MTVTLLARTPCLLCGYLHSTLMIASVRVNKRSLRSTGVMLGATRYIYCPECGTPSQGGMVPRSRYVLDPESAAKVAQYRQRRDRRARCGACRAEGIMSRRSANPDYDGDGWDYDDGDLADPDDDYKPCSWCGGEPYLQECGDPIQCCKSGCDGTWHGCDACNDTGLARHQWMW